MGCKANQINTAFGFVYYLGGLYFPLLHPLDMEPFLPLQKEFEKIHCALISQTPLTVDSVRHEPFLQIIDRSDYLITIHDVEYYRPICINEKLRKLYVFDKRVFKGHEHFF